MFKKNLVGLVIGGIIIFAAGGIIYTRGSFSQTFILVSQKAEIKNISKVNVHKLNADSTTTQVMTLEDKSSIRIISNALKNAEYRGLERMDTYDKAGTSTYLLEVYQKDQSLEKVYLALGPHNQGTLCVKESDPSSYMIGDEDTIKLRALIMQ